MSSEHDMAAPLRAVPDPVPEPGPGIVFCTLNRSRAQRVIARLHGIGKVRWESNPAVAALAQDSSGGGVLVLLDFSADAISRSHELARQLVCLAPYLPLVAVGSARGESSGVLAALRAGVRDFIDIDAAPEEAREVIRRVLAQPPLPAATAAAATAQIRKARVVVLLGVRAGVGTSTLAAHLGALGQLRQGKPGGADGGARTLLLDLGLPEGDGQLYLNLRSEFSYADAVRNAYRFDATLARTALPHHASGLAVLSRQEAMSTAALAGDEATLLTERLRSLFDLVLADLGGLAAGNLANTFVQSADEIWLVADQGVGSVVSMDEVLRSLQRLGIRRHLLQLVVNRHDADCGMSPHQIAERFSLPLLAVLPDSGHALRSSANLGRLLHESAPRDRYLRALAPLLRRLSPDRDADPSLARARGWRQLIRRWGGGRWTRM
jgi:pilus assembly protein CpaE